MILLVSVFCFPLYHKAISEAIVTMSYHVRGQRNRRLTCTDSIFINVWVSELKNKVQFGRNRRNSTEEKTSQYLQNVKTKYDRPHCLMHSWLCRCKNKSPVTISCWQLIVCPVIKKLNLSEIIQLCSFAKLGARLHGNVFWRWTFSVMWIS